MLGTLSTAVLQIQSSHSNATSSVNWASFSSFNLIYLLTAIELTPGDSSAVHIYTQTIHRTTQLTTLVARLSGIRTQSGQTKINDELTALSMMVLDALR